MCAMSVAVDDVAIRWAILIDAEDLDTAQQRELDIWLRQDERHRGALFRAQAGLALIDKIDGDSESCGRAMVLSQPTVKPRKRALMAGGALVACLVGLATVSWSTLSGQHYRTDVGEIRRVALTDGSVAMVNSDSDLRVRYNKTVRELQLGEGEAWFKVTKNVKRPFVVEADGVHVQATGTAFSVRRRTGAVEVVVTEGAVLAWQDTQQNAVSISAGSSAILSTATNAAKARVVSTGYRDPLAWRQGGIALNETTVFEAAEEFNRYNPKKIEVAKPRIGRQLMTGYFQIDRPDEFSQAVAHVTGASVSTKDNKYVIE
ncbi:iron dicitrate transporter FecR [Sphingobium sp. BS19]|nr:iron dicitrate transporter FecR [Sphingobium sp. BS19]